MLPLLTPHSAKGDTYTILKLLFQQLEIPFTFQKLRQSVLYHSQAESLLGISELLSAYRIENMAVQLTAEQCLAEQCLAEQRLAEQRLAEQLKEVPTPSIIAVRSTPASCPQCAENEPLFALLQAVSQEGVQLQYGNQELLFHPWAELAQIWDGHLLLLEAQEQSGETSYTENRQKARWEKVRQVGIISMAVLLLGMAGWQASSWEWSAWTVVKLLGTAFSIFLIQTEVGKAPSWVQQICKGGNTQGSGCQSVVSSKAAKLFGVISLSQIGLAYFGGGLLSLLLLAWSNPLGQDMPLVWESEMLFPYSISILALPFTLFSLYYQRFVVKQWCPLCVGVLLLLWVEAGLGLMSMHENGLNSIHLLGLEIWAGGHVLFLLILLLAYPWWKKQQQEVWLHKALHRFRGNQELLEAWLAAQPSVQVDHIEGEILLGNPDAPTEILMITNPYCGPCAKAHQAVKELLATRPDEFKVKIRFIGHHDAALELLSVRKEKQAEALSDWYSRSSNEEWAGQYSFEVSEASKKSLNRQVAWCQYHQVQATPTFFVNGRELVEPFTMRDL